MSDINFQANIKPISTTDFEKIIKKINKINSVDYPWTLKESITENNSFTKRICDCSACIITNGKQSLMMHLSPRIENNRSCSNLKKFLIKNLNLKEDHFSAILVGSQNNKKSLDLYNKLKEIFTEFKIPFSELQTAKTPTHIAYINSDADFYITNSTITKSLKKNETPLDCLKNAFEHIIISNNDTIK